MYLRWILLTSSSSSRPFLNHHPRQARCLSSRSLSPNQLWQRTKANSSQQIYCRNQLFHVPTRSASSKEADQRLKELEGCDDPYPRRHSRDDTSNLGPRSSRGPIIHIGQGRVRDGQHAINPHPRAVDAEPIPVEAVGRIINIRRSGRKLVFLDLQKDALLVQVTVNYAVISAQPGLAVSQNKFEAHLHSLRRGDHVAAFGSRDATSQGNIAKVKAVELPRLLAPCLHRFPVAQDPSCDLPEDSELGRHEEMFTYPSLGRTLVFRHKIIRQMRSFLNSNKFVEVQTPILAGSAGGASARPFETSATEFSQRKLSLRIAPELWLKRLVIAGLSRVYEIGPSFRNEGLDKTHNPEFTTCEFYSAYATLNDLIHMSESMLGYLEKTLETNHLPATLQESSPPPFQPRLNVIDFIPALSKHLEQDLPSLDLNNQDKILEILKSKQVPVPANPSLPNLLDKLSSHYLEPQTQEATWIINLPECMSPLSKSFTHPTAPNNQRVAARAELYVHQKELINCYEEENDPAVQRQKFIHQQIYAANPAGSPVDESKLSEADGMKIDEEYLRALEWGMPPTGGWGCGIDRLVMLFAGKERISDVLPFGNLRAVTRHAERWRKKEDRE